MNGPIWRPISDMPEAWRPFLITQVRQRSLRMRARHFKLYHVSEADERLLKRAWEALVQTHREPCDLTTSAYEAWRADRQRFLRLDCTAMANKEIVEGIDGDTILDHIDWTTGTFTKLTGEPNCYKQRAGYAMSGLEFDAAKAVALGCPIEMKPRPAARSSAIAERKSPRKRISPAEWDQWVAQYRQDHPVLPNKDNVIYRAARAKFGNLVTQQLVRETFTGTKPGPRPRNCVTQI